MQFNAAMAQAGDTAKLVGKASSAFAHGLDKIMGGKKGLFGNLGPMSHWKELPDAYLAYLYGVAPLADDVANAFETLNEFKNREFGYGFTCRAGRKDQEERTEDRYVQTWGNGQVRSVTWHLQRTIFTRVGYTFFLPDWFIQQTPTIAPFSTAYELTRYSFVLDWFLPIGQWLSAMESAQFSPFFREGFESVMIQDEWRPLSFDTTKHPFEYHITSGWSDAWVKSGCVRRSAIWSYPWSVLTPPSFKKLPGLQQAAQGLALLTQAFKRWR